MMKTYTRLTPTSRWRERLARWINDSERGQRFARWFAKTAAGLQLRLRIKSSADIPWTPLRYPLAKATVVIVTTSGVHLCSDEPFDMDSDASFRAIPRTATSADICISHHNYDRRDAERDLNLIFPLERLLELEAEGIIGGVADIHYGFGFTKDPQELLASGQRVGALLAQAHVDLALLVPA